MNVLSMGSISRLIIQNVLSQTTDWSERFVETTLFCRNFKRKENRCLRKLKDTWNNVFSYFLFRQWNENAMNRRPQKNSCELVLRLRWNLFNNSKHRRASNREIFFLPSLLLLADVFSTSTAQIRHLAYLQPDYKNTYNVSDKTIT